MADHEDFRDEDIHDDELARAMQSVSEMLCLGENVAWILPLVIRAAEGPVERVNAKISEATMRSAQSHELETLKRQRKGHMQARGSIYKTIAGAFCQDLEARHEIANILLGGNYIRREDVL